MKKKKEEQHSIVKSEKNKFQQEGLPWWSSDYDFCFNAGDEGSIPGGAVKIPHVSQLKNQNVKQKQYCNKFYKDFKNGPHQKKIYIKKRVSRREIYP